MKTIALKLALTALSSATFASATFAQSRPSTTRMSCSAASNIVQGRGAAVLGTGGDTFDRFVRDAGFCFHGQVLRPGFAPTADREQCLVGWRCYDETPKDR